MTKVTGKLILITGASRGIGAAIALAHRGARVLLLARTQHALEKIAEQISAQVGEARVYPISLSESEAVDHVTQMIKEEMGIPDVIINNAGTGKWLFTEETAPTEMVEMMVLPYFAAFNVTRSFLPEMIERKSGHIVNVTSAAELIVLSLVPLRTMRLAGQYEDLLKPCERTCTALDTRASSACEGARYRTEPACLSYSIYGQAAANSGPSAAPVHRVAGS